MFSMDHLMLKKKLKAVLKKALEKNSIDIFSNFVIKEQDGIKTIYDQDISKILEDAFKNQEITEELFNALNNIDANLVPVLKYRVFMYYHMNYIEDFLKLINTNRNLLDLENVHEVFYKLINSVNIDTSVEYLCIAGIYDESKFEIYFRESFKYNSFKECIKPLENSRDYCTLEKILQQCILVTGSKECYIKLAEMYKEREEKDNLKTLLDRITSIFNDDIDLTYFYSYLGDYNYVIKNSDKTSPANAILADAYYHIGDYERALKIYKYIYYNIDKNVLDRIIEITYSTHDYYSLLGYISSMEKNTNLKRQFILYKIEAEINLEMYSEAESDIAKYKAEFAEDPEILQLLIKYYINIDDQESAYRLASTLIERGISDKYNYKTAVGYLYENRRYGDLIKLLDANPEMSDFRPEYCSSLIYSGKIDNALNCISENNSLLDSGPVVDTLFEFLKSENRIKKFENIDISGTLLEMALFFIRGRKNVDYRKYMEKVYRNKSVACTYILASADDIQKIAFNKNYIRGLMGIEKYQTVGSIISSIYSIQNGIVPEDLNDSEYFLYPVSMALIRHGFYKQAAIYIESINNKSPDPFYYYIRALIDEHESSHSEAQKHVDEAINILENIDFYALRINIALQRNERPDSFIKSCIEKGFIDIFFQIDDFVEKNKIEVSDSFRELLTDTDVKNTGMYRLKAYCMDSYKIKLKFSALSVLHGGTSNDIVKHYSLLKSRNEKIAITFLEYYPVKKYVSYIILCSYYYSKRIYKKTLEYFNAAYIRNRKAEKNPVFQEISTGNIISQKIIGDMESRNEWFDLLLFYYYRKEYTSIREIIQNHYSNTKILQFAINFAWETMSLKEFMLELFRKTGDKIMGELLAGKFHEMELYSYEIDILKKLTGSYPLETANLDKLINALILNNQEDEALKLSYENYHNNKSKSSFNRMIKTAYTLKDYASVVNICGNNAEFIDARNIEYFIDAEIKLFNYVGARVAMKEYSDLITEDIKNNIETKIKASYRTRIILKFAGDIFKMEIENNTIFNFHEMQKYIPGYISTDVYNFITNDMPYTYIGREDYNERSRNIIKRLKETGILSLNKIKIHDIYNVTDDVIIAKNFYVFIGRAMDGYYKSSLHGNWKFTSDANRKDVPGIIEAMIKYDIGILDSIAISEKIKKGAI